MRRFDSDEAKAWWEIQAARIILVEKHPFFGHLCLNLVPKAAPMLKPPTMACDERGRLYYHPKFVLSLSRKKLLFGLAHEVLHLAEKHFARRGHRHPKRWNKAGDYAINQLLVDAGFEPIDGCLLDEQYRGMPSEAIYSKLPEEDETSGGGGDGDGSSVGSGQCGSAAGGKGHVDGPDGVTEPGDTGVDPETWSSRVASAAEYAKSRGNLPAVAARYVEERLYPKLNWKEILIRMLRASISAASGRDDFSYARLSRRVGALRAAWTGHGKPPILASMVAHEPGDVVIAIDTSGSIGGAELHRFISETMAIIEHVGRPVKVLYSDAGICSEVTTQDYAALVKSAKGGGGTSFIPVFDYVEKMKKKPVAVVYHTDLYGSFPAKSPKGVPVIWCVPHRDPCNVPFGKRVNVDL